MARSAFNIIAEVHHDMGSPGLAFCMETLGDNFDNLSPEIATAYEEFYEELQHLASQSTE